MEHFLVVSYEKLLGSTASSLRYRSGAEKYTVFSYEFKEQVRKRKTVEEFLDASHKNLLNWKKLSQKLTVLLLVTCYGLCFLSERK